ncbi:MAG: MFS transporter [Aquabacterium sp.]|nr:MAG: MFS transporter [Aquabacterium sp.]
MSTPSTGAPAPAPAFWPLVLAASAIFVLTMGARQSMGLFISPLNTATGLGLVSISFAFAIAQLSWGAFQPVFGAMADRWGPARVVVLGGVLLAAGTALTPFVHSQGMLIVTAGLMAPAGAAAGSFSILIGATAQRLPAERRAFASGFINAGGSFGQGVFAIINQAMISAYGWVVAMVALGASALFTLPLARALRQPAHAGHAAAADGGMREQLRAAFRNKSYWCLHAGFFVCGFHIAFLVTHLPGEVGLCGLPASVAATALSVIGLANIAGSLTAGALSSRMQMKVILFWNYLLRGIIVAVYLVAPKTPATFYVFGAALGFTWLSTVPPTVGLVGKLFGTRYLATLFGMTLLSHQIGGFFGAWLGGIARATSGDYHWMWYADIVLAVAAALANLPIEEDPVPARRPVAA